MDRYVTRAQCSLGLVILALLCTWVISSCNGPGASSKNAVGDTARIKKWYERGLDSADRGNRQAAVLYIDSGLNASRAAGNAEYEGQAHLALYYLFMTCGKEDSAKSQVDTALAIFAKGKYEGRHYLSARIAKLTFYIAGEKITQLADEGNEILQLAKAQKDTLIMARALGRLGHGCLKLTDFKKAAQHFNEAIALVKKTAKKEGLTDFLDNLAYAYNGMGEFERSLTVGYELVSLSSADEIIRAYAYVVLCQAHVGLHNPDSALHYLKKAEILNRNFGDENVNFAVVNNLVDIYLEQKNYKDVLPIIDARIAEADATNDSNAMPALYSRRVEVLEGLGRYKEALEAEKIANKGKEYQSGDEMHKQAAMIEGKYKLKEKERSVEQLTQQSALQRRWLTAVIVVLGIAVVLGIVIFVQYRRKQQANIIMQQQAERLQWLMREIHHRVKNNLHVIISLINMQLRKAQSPEIEHLLNDTVNRIHSISIIHQRLYQDKNVDAVALEDYIAQLGEAILAVNGDAQLVIHSSLSLDTDTTIILGLAITELITNSCKYARLADRPLVITIDVSATGGGYIFRYRDNGPGMPANAEPKDTLGMHVVRLMARQMGGTLRSHNNNGACFVIHFKDEAQRKLVA